MRFPYRLCLYAEAMCVIVWCFLPGDNSFNVDTKHAAIRQGPAGSYFGFSVAFYHRLVVLERLVSSARTGTEEEEEEEDGEEEEGGLLPGGSGDLSPYALGGSGADSGRTDGGDSGRPPKILLVGAPRAKSSDPQGTFRTGSLYECPARAVNGRSYGNNNTGPKCKPSPWLQPVAASNQILTDAEDDQWLGVSMATHTKASHSLSYVVCDNRWSAPENISLNQTYHIRGTCYRHVSRDEDYHVTQLHPLPPVPDGVSIDASGRVSTGYAHGQAGTAAHFTKGGGLVLGAPGLRDWRGGLVTYSPDQIHCILEMPEDFPASSYAGYAVTSGVLSSRSVIQIVVGAPRYNYVGQVFTTDGTCHPNPYEMNQTHITREIKRDHTFTGDQFGAYFGAAVCVDDVTGDGHDDVIVGAPLYAGVGAEEGAVYVYRATPSGVFHAPVMLRGSSGYGARFGASIASAGDLDRDGVNDIAVGAPYEGDGRGAVYIYNGHPHTGVRDPYQQRIDPEQLGYPLSSFGHSIAVGMDVDDNDYPDLAVGAYASDSVVILYSRPVLRLVVDMRVTTSPINLRHTPCDIQGRMRACVTVYVTCYYDGQGVPDEIDVSMVLEADSAYTARGLPSRGWFWRGSATPAASTLQLGLTLQKGVGIQENVTLYFKEDPENIEVAFGLFLRYQLGDNSTTEADPLNGTRTLPPVLQAPPGGDYSVYRSIYFLTDNATADGYNCDLHFSLMPSFPAGRTHVILGEDAALSVDVFLRNKGPGSAEQIETSLTFPRWVTFTGVRQNAFAASASSVVVCSVGPAGSTRNNTVTCDVRAILALNTLLTFTLTFDLPVGSALGIPSLDDVINGSVKGLCQESDEQQEDNNATLSLSLGRKSTVISSPSDQEQIFYHALDPRTMNDDVSDKCYGAKNITHVVELANRGPGYMADITMHIHVPVPDDNAFYSVDPEFSVTGPKLSTISCETKAADLRGKSDRRGNMNFTECLHPMEDQSLVVNTPASAEPKPEVWPWITTIERNSVVIDCSTTRCQTLTCKLPVLFSGDSVNVDVSLRVNVSALVRLGDVKSVEFYSVVDVRRAEMHTIQDAANKTMATRGGCVKIHTSLLPELSSLVDDLLWTNCWVLVVAAVLGLFVFAVLSSIMHRAGFFRRKYKEKIRQTIKDDRKCELISNIYERYGNEVDDDLANEILDIYDRHNDLMHGCVNSSFGGALDEGHREGQLPSTCETNRNSRTSIFDDPCVIRILQRQEERRASGIVSD